ARGRDAARLHEEALPRVALLGVHGAQAAAAAMCPRAKGFGPVLSCPLYVPHRPTMPGLLPNVDPDGLLEFSVVYTDRALNHMSRNFQGVMKDISAILKEVYNARSAVLVPGSGTFGMESVARQFATGRDVLVLRN